MNKLTFIYLRTLRAFSTQCLSANIHPALTSVFIWLSICLATFSLSACTSGTTLPVTTASSTPTPSSTPTATASGARAVKIIFQQNSGGSFDAPPSSGTPAVPGSGLQATRVFNADGSLLASGGTSANAWPQWLSSFEIGISGTSNTSSQNGKCANFADTNESNAMNCILGTTASKCGAYQSQFRISEVDCSLNSPVASAGNGGPNDGIYLRAVFNRNTSYLGPYENILVVLEYSASSLNAAPASPTNCFSGGNFSPELCSDFVWRAYIKHSTSEVVQPYLLLIPPTFASVIGSNQTANQNGGTTISTKQFILPFAGDANLSILQLSRTQSNFSGNPSTSGTSAYNLKYYCTNNGNYTGSSPLCAGVIFYSMTFFRI